MARRRLVTVAAAGVLALTALAGCRSEPGSAAFVGDTRITTNQVNDVLDGVRADGVTVDPTREGTIRQEVTAQLVFLDVAKRYATEKGFPAPTPDYQTVADRNKLPTSDPFVRLVAESQAYDALLKQQIKPATVTDADYLQAADAAIAQGVADPSQRDKLAASIKQDPGFADEMAHGIAVRNELTDAIKRYNVTVNPAFGPAATTLVSGQTDGDATISLVVLPLTAGATTAPAVIDLTKTE